MLISVSSPAFGVSTCRQESFFSQKAARRRKSSSTRAAVYLARMAFPASTPPSPSRNSSRASSSMTA